MKFYLSLLLVLVISCKKDRVSLNGPINVSGRILDFVSNQAIPNAQVELISTTTQFNQPSYKTEAIDTTDASGNYSFTFNATGQDVFQVLAQKSPYYMSSDNTAFQNAYINNPGAEVLDLKCHRTAFARVTLINVPPIDTCSSIVFYGYNQVKLFNFYRDTVFYLQVPAVENQENSFTYKFSFESAVTRLAVDVAAWDTMHLQRNY